MNNDAPLLLTPGPLTTSPTVRQAMLRDWGTWDDDYNLGVVTPVRQDLVKLATTTEPGSYTCVPIQGSGTFTLEAVIGSVIPPTGKLLILANGAYGTRLATIAQRLEINHLTLHSDELTQPDLPTLKTTLANDPAITHVAAVHVETSTGITNPIKEISSIVKSANKTLIVDSMSAFGGIPIDVAKLNIDFLVSSSNKCLQGVPGFAFTIAKTDELQKTKGYARSLSLDLFDQWQGMEQNNGKWRFTSPTHVVNALHQAIQELKDEGGVKARYARYQENHRRLIHGMENLGFNSILPKEIRSPVIASFHHPTAEDYDFLKFYHTLKEKGFIIYAGKLTTVDSFRIGTIGHVFPDDIDRLLLAIKDSMYWGQ